MRFTTGNVRPKSLEFNNGALFQRFERLFIINQRMILKKNFFGSFTLFFWFLFLVL